MQLSSSPNDSKPVILIVDDIADNLQLLGSMLRIRGYTVAAAQSGEQALKTIEKKLPDIILLDIQMPEMNGYEVCQHLKNKPETKDIPIIFLTAQTETEDIIHGFKAGAVDYITKPFNTAELLARVQTHLDLKRARDIIAEKSRRLELLNEGLMRLNNEKDEFMGIAAHDLKSPLTAIRGLAEFLQYEPSMPPERIQEILHNIVLSADRMFSLIKNLLDVNALEEGSMNAALEYIHLHGIVQNVVERFTATAAEKRITLHYDTPLSDSIMIFANANIITQIGENLLSNAIKYSPFDKNVYVRILVSEGNIRCEIQDEGPGLSDVDKQKLFGKFAQLSARPTADEHSTGLGLYIVKKFTESMNGRVWCESIEGQGATFIVEFPQAEQL